MNWGFFDHGFCNYNMFLSICRARSNVCGNDRYEAGTTEIRKDMDINTTLDYSWSTIRIGIAKRKHAGQKSKLDRPFWKIIQAFLGPFVSNAMQVISCLSAVNMRVAGATIDRSSTADAEIWPEAANANCVAQCTEALSWGDEDQWGYDNWMEISEN